MSSILVYALVTMVTYESGDSDYRECQLHPISVHSDVRGHVVFIAAAAVAETGR